MKSLFKVIIGAILFTGLFLNSYVSYGQYDIVYIVNTKDLHADVPSSLNTTLYSGAAEAYEGPLDLAMQAADTYLSTAGNENKTAGILFRVPYVESDENSALVRVTVALLEDLYFDGTGVIVFDNIGEGRQGVMDETDNAIAIFQFDKVSVKFSGLYIKTNYHAPSAIRCDNNYDDELTFIAKNNTIIASKSGIKCYNLKAVEVDDNIIQINDLSGNGAIVVDNIDNASVTNNYLTGRGGIYAYFYAPNHVYISNNKIFAEYAGIQIDYKEFYSGDSDNCFITENEITSNEYGLHIVNPCKGLVISNNDIYYIYYGAWIEENNSLNQHTAPSFVNPNSLGYQETNSNNNFYLVDDSFTDNATIYYRSDVTPYTSNEISHVVGLDLSGPVVVFGSERNILVRDNVICNQGDRCTPIEIVYDDGTNAPNGNIQPPEISGLTYSNDGEVDINYTIPGLSSTNGPFVVDIYGSNENNDLLTLVDSHDIGSVVSGSYSKTIADNFDIYSMTVTSLGNPDPPHNYTNGIGTSRAKCVVPGFTVDMPQTICVGEQYSLNVYGSTPGSPPPPYLFKVVGDFDYIPGPVPASFNNSDPGIQTYCVMPAEGGMEQCYEIEVIDCPDTHVSCEDCIGTFAPEPGGKYLVGAWVSESTTEYVHTYENAALNIKFYNTVLEDYTGITPIEELELYASGNIIDGWQKIEEVITIPVNARGIEVELVNNYSSGTDVFFDDIRFQPFNSSMKTYAYDYTTGRLAAVNDENNYATFYEYDEEGALIRVKKETERGVMTIQESRNEMKTDD